MGTRRLLWFRLAAIGLSLAVLFAVLLAVDVYLHGRYLEMAGYNVWGYRGPAVGGKEPGEWRLAVLGESTAFGYGVRWDEAIPAYLEQLLNASGLPDGRSVRVVNLAFNNEGAYSYKFTLRDYDYLDYDGVLFYSGYNDLGSSNHHNFRHTSVVYRLTGYMPIFPVIFQEKAMALRYNGDLESAYRGRQTAFQPNLGERATASALMAAARISRSLDQQFAIPMADTLDEPAVAVGAACGPRWAHYCGEMHESVGIALGAEKHVLVVTQPYKVDHHVEQQDRLVEFLRARFPANPRLHFANVGRTVDLKEPALAYDGLHLTVRGNRIIAEALVPHVRPLIP